MLPLENEADLQRLIDAGVSEYLHLELKAGDALTTSVDDRRELSKDVSALANADGGQIIYGLDENKNGPIQWWPVQDAKVTVEWIENVIHQLVRPKIEGIRVRSVQRTSGDRIFVIDIPAASSFGPHQAWDHKYYRRHERKAAPMEDYEVRAAMRRRIEPELDLTTAWGFVHAHEINGGPQVYVDASVNNHSPEPAIYSATTFFADHRIQALPNKDFAADYSIAHPAGPTIHGHTIELAAPRHFPIFRERSARLPRMAWAIPGHLNEYNALAFAYRVVAPGYQKTKFLRVELRSNGPRVTEVLLEP